MKPAADCSRCARRSSSKRDERTERERLIVTEMPYQVNKAKLIEKIAELIQDERIKGISDLRDESSDREGVRVVIELKRNEIPLVVLNNLYKHTQLETTFGVIMLALVNNRPEVLNLKQILHHFIEHRREVVVRRTAYELRKAEERAHILEGLKIALDNLDAVIALIRRSQSPDEARAGLMRQFCADGDPGKCHSRHAAPTADAARARLNSSRNIKRC